MPASVGNVHIGDMLSPLCGKMPQSLFLSQDPETTGPESAGDWDESFLFGNCPTERRTISVAHFHVGTTTYRPRRAGSNQYITLDFQPRIIARGKHQEQIWSQIDADSKNDA